MFLLVTFKILGNNNGNTGGLVTAVQDQKLDTRYINKYILKKGAINKCRMCNRQPETAVNILSGC